MIFGKPWSNAETDLLYKSYVEGGYSLEGVKELFSKKGFTRSVDAIKRKLQRLNTAAYVKQTAKEIADFIDPYGNQDDPVNEINYVSGPLPLSAIDKYTKFIMLNDVHVPHNIPLENVFKFAADFKPDYMLLVGDIITNDPFSHWDKKIPARFKTMPEPKPYYEKCNNLFYRPLRKTVGNNCKIVHWIGNHEYWSNKAIEEMPEGKGYWEVENNIDCIDAWVESKGIASLGKLNFIHGDILKSGYNCAQKVVSLFHRSVRFGHFHHLEEASQINPMDVKDVHTARCCGTLEKPNPHYMFNQPNRWVNSFTYGVINNSDGTFSDHTTVITDNKFMAYGKLYG